MSITLQGILQKHYSSYKHKQTLSIDQIKAAEAMMACCTEALGSQEWVCHEDGYSDKQHHSCRHRNCPQCTKAYIDQWVQKTEARLLPCDHYHVVFTLPHEFNDVWQHNRKWCADALFKAAAETLTELLKDPRHLGAKAGLLISLHTWGRSLTFHPHVHVLITGGGIDHGQWRAVQNDFLLPVGVLKAKFRGKWLAWVRAAYRAGDLQLPQRWQAQDWYRLLHVVSRKKWNVCIQGPYRHGKGVTRYLARYVHGGPMKNHNLEQADDRNVTFAYKDYRDERIKPMTLKADIFLSRVFWHIPVKGQHNVRYYGLYLPAARKERDQVREQMNESTGEAVPEKPVKLKKCPHCGKAMRPYRSTRRQISYIKNTAVKTDDGLGPLFNKQLMRSQPDRAYSEYGGLQAIEVNFNTQKGDA